MDADRFAQGFDRESDIGVSRAPMKQRAGSELMQVSRRWSSFFNRALTQQLEGGETYSTEYLQRMLNTYANHETQQHFIQLPSLLRTLAMDNPEDTIYLNNLNFHTMSQAMLPVWEALLLPERESAARQNKNMIQIQTQLAIRGLELVRFLPITPTSVVDAAITGQVTEIDAAISVLEVIKQGAGNEPSGLVVIPSPSLYEGSPTHPERTSDLILIDTTRTIPEVRGLQVKTTPSRHHYYDPEYVSVIVGATDLGNNVPGLIAADFLLGDEAADALRYPLDRRQRLPQGNAGAAEAARAVALERLELSARNYPNRAAVAARKIGPRILADLYEDRATA